MPLFDKIYDKETYENTALLGLCDVTVNNKKFENERIRLDLKKGIVRIEFAKLLVENIVLGISDEIEFQVSNVSIHTRGVNLKLDHLDYSFIASSGGKEFSVSDSPLANVLGFHSRPSHVGLICNNPIEFDVDVEAYERRFYTKFDFYKISLASNLVLNGSKTGFSISGEPLFEIPNVDSALAITVGSRSAWAAEWQANKLRIRLNGFKEYPRKSNPIFSTGEGWVSIDEAQKNAQDIFPLALKWLDGLEKQQLTKALVAIDSLLSARMYGQEYMLGLFGAFRFWEWIDNAKTLSRDPLASCLGITKNESQALIDIRNDLIHGKEFTHQAILKCDTKLREVSTRYVDDFEMHKPAATVMNYIHSISGEALMNVIGYDGPTQKYFPLSGTKLIESPHNHSV